MEKEIQVCAQCHSRRNVISSDYSPGKSFLDHYMPRLLDEGMYFVDGQIQDEVYVYGSFLKSKMYHAGVTCSNCWYKAACQAAFFVVYASARLWR